MPAQPHQQQTNRRPKKNNKGIKRLSKIGGSALRRHICGYSNIGFPHQSRTYGMVKIATFAKPQNVTSNPPYSATKLTSKANFLYFFERLIFNNIKNVSHKCRTTVQPSTFVLTLKDKSQRFAKSKELQCNRTSRPKLQHF